jgi:hypothetical protein
VAKRPAKKAAAAPAAPAAPAIDLADLKKRSDKAWSVRTQWDGLYAEAYDYAVPNRRPAGGRNGVGQAAARTDRLFDNTAIVSTFRFAGQLQNDLFPPGQPFFKLAPGPIAELAMSKEELVEGERELGKITKVVQACFLTGEWDQAAHEMCLDLAVGTGALLMPEGDGDRPVRFVNVPSDEVAIEPGPYGDLALVSWKTRMTRRQIRAAFPKGNFDVDFMRGDNANPDEELELRQEFIDEGKAGWRFVAYCDACKTAIVTTHYRTRPIAVPRYYRVPGEAYGRGPVLLALPTIKTLNKAMELTLKAAAIQMLGIWGYRPGGAFNPDTVRVAPGAMWPMGSTGGVMGPDVTRLDPAAGKIDVGNLITQELRTQVQAALHDVQLGPEAGTPKSATEIMARMKRISENYMGAFGRLVHEIVPVVVRRAIECCYNVGLIKHDVKIDELLVKTVVLSPIAAALKAAALSTIVEFMQLVATVKGEPHAVELLVKVDDALRHIGLSMGVPAEFIQSTAEQQAIEKKLADAAGQLAAAQAGAGQQVQAPTA